MQLHSRWAKAQALPGRFVRMNITCSTIIISYLWRSTWKEASGPCWIIRMFFQRFTYILLLRNLGQFLHISSANMWMRLSILLQNSLRRKPQSLSTQPLIGWRNWDTSARMFREEFMLMGIKGMMWLSTRQSSLHRWGNINSKSKINVEFSQLIISQIRLVETYDKDTLQPTPPKLNPGKKEHVSLSSDECINHTNDGWHQQWLQGNQQPLKKKGNSQGNHICGWISEETGHLQLSYKQIAAQALLPEDQHLKITDSWKIIYPGKGFDDWWDLKQLLDAMVHTINIFEVTHPGKVEVFLFNCWSAHEELAADALNINKMNINLGRKQVHLRSTTIPLNNPPPKPGQPDIHGQPQDMSYPDDHPDPSLQGEAKMVLQERVLVWDKTVEMNGRKVPAGKCWFCKKSQVTKDAERRIAEAEALDQEDTVTEEDLADACNPVDKLSSDWCCLYWVLSLQDNFTNEKPMIQHYIEEWGHIVSPSLNPTVNWTQYKCFGDLWNTVHLYHYWFTFHFH